MQEPQDLEVGRLHKVAILDGHASQLGDGLGDPMDAVMRSD
jgi:hypothetical protein